MGGINTNSKDSGDNSSQVSNIKSTDTSFVGKNGTENLGIAVFKKDKLVGELTALETLCLSILQRQVNSFLVQVPDPEDKNEKIDIMLYPVDNRQVKVKIINGSPFISIKADFIGRIYSMKEDSKYLENSVLEDLSSQVNNYLEKILTDYLYKTSLEFKADINNFGRYASRNFLTISEYEDFDWQSSYPNSIFNVEINTNVESGFLVTES